MLKASLVGRVLLDQIDRRAPFMGQSDLTCARRHFVSFTPSPTMVWGLSATRDLQPLASLKSGNSTPRC